MNVMVALVAAAWGAETCGHDDVCARACRSGKANACIELGSRVPDGEAFRLYREACELGSNDGCVRVATAYRYGTGVPRSEVRATRQLSETCALSLRLLGARPSAGGPGLRPGDQTTRIQVHKVRTWVELDSDFARP